MFFTIYTKATDFRVKWLEKLRARHRLQEKTHHLCICDEQAYGCLVWPFLDYLFSIFWPIYKFWKIIYTYSLYKDVVNVNLFTLAVLLIVLVLSIENILCTSDKAIHSVAKRIIIPNSLCIYVFSLWKVSLNWSFILLFLRLNMVKFHPYEVSLLLHSHLAFLIEVPR